MSKELNINEAYSFENLRVVPMADQKGNKYLKIYADNLIVIHPISDNALTIYNQE